MQIEQEQKPKVGIGVMILKDGKVLLTRRKGSHGEGEYAFPGGHLEYMESFEECARREVMEECGIEMQNIKFLYLTNITKYAPKHYVHIGFIAEYKSGVPKTMEPEKAGEWIWYDLDNLPEPMFEFCRLSFDAYKTGKNYYSTEDKFIAGTKEIHDKLGKMGVSEEDILKDFELLRN